MATPSTQSTLTFITESLPQFTVGVYQAVDLEASGGTPPYTFAITSGTLPAGLNLSGGTLSGTATAAVMSTVFFKLSDTAGDSVTQAMDVICA